MNNVNEIFSNPEKTVENFSEFCAFLTLLIWIFIVLGYFFSLHSISSNAILPLSIIMAIWSLLFFLAWKGVEKNLFIGKVAAVLSWLPVLFAIPVGTAMAIWVYISLYKIGRE